MLSFPTLWHVFVFGMPYKSIRNLVQLTWIYLSFQFISCIPLLYRIPSSCLLISPFTKHLQGNFKTDSDGMWDIHYNSWKIKKKLQLFTNQISSKGFHECYVGPLTEKTQNYRETNMKTRRNASWNDFSTQQPNNLHIPQGKIKTNKTEKQNKETLNKKNNQQDKDHLLLIKCFAWTRRATFLVLFLWAQEAYCGLMGNESPQK